MKKKTLDLSVCVITVFPTDRQTNKQNNTMK